MMRGESLQHDVVSLLAAREGHFRFESGHHGRLWLELDLLYLRPTSLRPLVAVLAERLSRHNLEAVCGPLVGGAFLAQMVATELDREFVYAEQIVPVRSDGLYPVKYRVPDALRPGLCGKAVAIVDDVINAGSAVGGAFADLRACDARPVALGALLTLGATPARFAADKGLPLESLAHLPSDLWEPSDCPLCAARVPLSGK